MNTIEQHETTQKPVTLHDLFHEIKIVNAGMGTVKEEVRLLKEARKEDNHRAMEAFNYLKAEIHVMAKALPIDIQAELIALDNKRESSDARMEAADKAVEAAENAAKTPWYKTTTGIAALATGGVALLGGGITGGVLLARRRARKNAEAAITMDVPVAV